MSRWNNPNCGFQKGHKPFITFEGCRKISEALKGEKHYRWKGGKPKCIDCNCFLSTYKAIRCRKCQDKYRIGEKLYSWKGGVSTDKNYLNKRRKERRHLLGISKKYNQGLSKEQREIRKKAHNALYKERFKQGGKLTIQIIQQIYENNIKQFGNLTCYLCLKPVEFGQDCLEHKIPLSRGGTNDEENLAIAHQVCNNRKHTKTEGEFKNANHSRNF